MQKKCPRIDPKFLEQMLLIQTKQKGGSKKLAMIIYIFIYLIVYQGLRKGQGLLTTELPNPKDSTK